jgi:hypothetical protein
MQVTRYVLPLECIKKITIYLYCIICYDSKSKFLILQARTHQLLLQNRDLLDHMKQILSRLQTLEMQANNSHDTNKMIEQVNTVSIICV